MSTPLRLIAIFSALVFGTLASYSTSNAVAQDDDEFSCSSESGTTSHSGDILASYATNAGGVVYDAGGFGSTAALKLRKAGGNFNGASFNIPESSNSKPFLGCTADANNDGWVDLIGTTIGVNKVGIWYNETRDNQVGADTSTWSLIDTNPGNGVDDCVDYDWTNINCAVTPKFTRHNQWIISGQGSQNGNNGQISCGDFNLDGRVDFLVVNGTNSNSQYRKMFLNTGNDINGLATWAPPYDIAPSGSFYGIGQEGNIWAEDLNGDGWPDIVQPGEKTSNRGAARIYLSDQAEENNPSSNTADSCPDPRGPDVNIENASCRPKFIQGTELVTGLVLGGAGATTLAYFDYNGDGQRELLIAGQHDGSQDSIFMFPGINWDQVDTAAGQRIAIQSNNKQAFLLPGDLSLDGIPDLLTGDDFGDAEVQYFKNKGTNNLADLFEPVVATQPPGYNDFDTAGLVDYDHDPDGTQDALILDGNSNKFMVLVNRVLQEYVPCGTVYSEPLDLGTLEDVEFQISDIQIVVDEYRPPGTDITYEVTKTDGGTVDDWTWVPMNDCGDVDDLTYCANVAHLPGRSIRWRAHLYSRVDGAGNGVCTGDPGNATPELRSIDISFDYFPDQQHVQAGSVISEDIAYVGTYEELGQRGSFSAGGLNSASGTFYWDAGQILDSADLSGGAATGQSVDNRNILVGHRDESTGIWSQVPFHWDHVRDNDPTYGNSLLDVFGIGTTTARARELVEWVRSPRFGKGASKTRLGAIFNSTPAIVGPAPAPIWYNYADGEERIAIESFLATHVSRKTIAIFSSMDGMIHGIYSDPGSPEPTSDLTSSGHEAWGFIPFDVARRFNSDYTNDEITAFPDGAPTVADVMDDLGDFHTIAIVGGGNGSKSFTALDVTDPVSPKLLWELQPGGNFAGQSYSKATIARIRDGINTRFIAIMATGVDNDNQSPPWDKGRRIAAVDAYTGELLWRFEAACPVTSSLSTYEVEDDSEGTDYDGFMDRLVFGDYCGNLYKLKIDMDYSDDLDDDGIWADGEGWNLTSATNTSGLGGVYNTGHMQPGTLSMTNALFSIRDPQWATKAMAGQPLLDGFLEDVALNDLTVDNTAPLSDVVMRPITGTIAIRDDGTGVPYIYFGTGGRESYDTSQRNAMFAVNSVTGVVRDAVAGACDGLLPRHCEKFYNGIVVNSEQVIFTVATDSQGVCDQGSSRVVISPINRVCSLLAVSSDPGDSNYDERCQQVVNLTASVVSSVFSYGAGIVFGTRNGEIAVVGDLQGDGTSGQDPGGDGQTSEHGRLLFGNPVIDGNTNSKKIRCATAGCAP